MWLTTAVWVENGVDSATAAQLARERAWLLYLFGAARTQRQRGLGVTDEDEPALSAYQSADLLTTVSQLRREPPEWLVNSAAVRA